MNGNNYNEFNLMSNESEHVQFDWMQWHYKQNDDSEIEHTCSSNFMANTVVHD